MADQSEGCPVGADAGAGTDFAADPHRPAYHFVAPGGWLNDPNGVGRRDGVYHLFYQYNPHAAVHGRIHWGHATSRDLVTWTDEPVALVPGESGPDRDGCYSGVLVDDDGVPTLVYSGHRDDSAVQTCCLATGSPDLRRWTKDPGNPVARAPEDLDLVEFRDHSVWREPEGWRQLIGSGLRGVGGAALLYEGTDLRHWRYVGPLLFDDGRVATLGSATGFGEHPGAMWECVELFHLFPDGTSGPPDGSRERPGRDVLAFSAWADGVLLQALCLTGHYRGRSFEPVALHRLDLGERAFYAPQSFTDDDGRRVMFGWLPEERPEAAAVVAGWAGAMALPRVVTLDDSGVPRFAPAVEVAALRGDRTRLVGEGAAVDRVALAAGDLVPGPRGDQLDLELDVVLPPGGRVRLGLRASPDGAERTVVEVGRAGATGSGVLRLDRGHSSRSGEVDAVERSGTVPVGEDGRVRVRALVDHSVLEVFVNGRALSARVYPTTREATGTWVTVPATSAPGAVVERFDAWRMRGVWTDRRSRWP